MDPQLQQPTTAITRRGALRSGAALTSGLLLGGAVVGSATAVGGTTVRAVPVDLFVRAADDPEPSPIPDPQDLLVNRVGGNPIDDGTIHTELDGTHQLTWGEFSAIQGKASVMCKDGGTQVRARMTGLVPDGLYTMWVVVFGEGGFITETRDIEAALFPNLLGVGSLGQPDGSENVFRANGSTAMVEAWHPPGPLSAAGAVEGCLLEEYEVHLVAVLHLDDQSHGPIPELPPPNDGTLAEQLTFVFGMGV